MHSTNADVLLVGLFAIFACLAVSEFYIGYRLIAILSDKYPKYYESAGSPSFNSLNIRRSFAAQNLLFRLMFKDLPPSFPDDPEIARLVGWNQKTLPVSLLIWLVMVILTFRG